jgi:uncharacterized protein
MEIAITIIIFIIIAALIIGGIAGIFVPFLPDALLVLAGVFVYGIYDRFEHVGIFTFLILSILTLVVAVIDYLATAIGAKKFGATKFGIAGGVLGGIIGLFIGSIFGFLIGFFLGALMFELLIGRSFKDSLKSGSGAIIGFLGGTLFKLMIILLMIIIFVMAILFW